MQVDGSGHFKDTHHMQEGHQLQLDLKCCRAAWMACGRLLRVHHESGLMCRVVMAAVCTPHTIFVMVSSQYTSVAVAWAGITKSYTDWLLSATEYSVLVGSKCYFHSATDCIIYCWLPFILGRLARGCAVPSLMWHLLHTNCEPLGICDSSQRLHMSAACAGIHHHQYVDFEAVASLEQLIGLWCNTLCGSSVRLEMQLVSSQILAYPGGALIHSMHI